MGREQKMGRKMVKSENKKKPEQWERGREIEAASLISAAQTADEAELPIFHHFSSDDFSILQIWPENMI